MLPPVAESSAAVVRELNPPTRPGFPVPFTFAVSMARPLFPRMSLATDPNLMLASSRMRFFRRDRSATQLVRSRLSSRKSRSTVSGTKLGFSSPCCISLSNPLAVFYVRLSSRHILDMGRIGQQQLKLSFQQVPDRSPVDSRALHGDHSQMHLREPVRHQIFA